MQLFFRVREVKERKVFKDFDDKLHRSDFT